MTRATQLIHCGTSQPLSNTSHPAIIRTRCTKAIIRNTTAVTVAYVFLLNISFLPITNYTKLSKTTGSSAIHADLLFLLHHGLGAIRFFLWEKLYWLFLRNFGSLYSPLDRFFDFWNKICISYNSKDDREKKRYMEH